MVMIGNEAEPLIAAIIDALDLRGRPVTRIDIEAPAGEMVRAVVTFTVDRAKVMAALVALAEQGRIAAATKATSA